MNDQHQDSRRHEQNRRRRNRSAEKNFEKKKTVIYISYLPWTCKFVQLASRRKDYKGNLSITENWKLKSFFQQPISPLWEGNLSACGVFYTPHLSFSSHHFSHFSEFQQRWGKKQTKISIRWSKKKCIFDLYFRVRFMKTEKTSSKNLNFLEIYTCLRRKIFAN